MCGIVGVAGSGNVVPGLVECMRRLEYRGYDSAGVAVASGRRLRLAKGEGPIEASAKRFAALSGPLAVGHTRWATHGPPSERNAHPHADCSGRIAVVHNGIIENYAALKSKLEAARHRFRSETDTEVVPHLLEDAYRGDLEAALRAVLPRLTGSFAIVAVAADSPVLVGARRDAPLAVGLAPGANLLASDIPALLPKTRRVLPLEDLEMAVVDRSRVTVKRFDGKVVRRAPIRVTWRLEDAEKAGYDHFMLKEIHEQPRALRETLAGRVSEMEGVVEPPLELGRSEAARISRVLLTGCGSSYHAALFGRVLVERLAGLPAEARVSSELRLEAGAVGSQDLLVAISQSGETADTLAASRIVRASGARTVALCNTVGSTLARESGSVLFTHAGPEVSVAATKTFTTQAAALAVLALHLGRLRGKLSLDAAAGHARDLARLPGLVLDLIERREAAVSLAKRVGRSKLFFFLGRGLAYPVALEGALKLKEVACIPAEGHPAGELKHGPLALVDPGTPVVGVALPGPAYPKLLSNLKEVKARDAPVYAVALEGDREIENYVDGVLWVPESPEVPAAILSAVALQVLAYEIARLRGCPIDRPRNLAKSVTVE
ncbi:MAG: glutamine--fructose-6-phosphate transaminase (isomerizing) [Halobacteria archaeon]